MASWLGESKPSSPTGKKPLKGKIVLFYESIFKGDDVTKNNPDFWHEIFLLKVNAESLMELIEALSVEELSLVKENINLLFCHCCRTLRQDHQIKVINALQTLCIVIRSIYKKNFSDFGFEVLNILIGFDDAEAQLQRLIELLNSFLLGDYSVSLRNLTLKLLLIMVTAVDNVSQNTLLEFLMMNSVFETITQILANPSLRADHGYEAALLLTLLVQYRKHEGSNPYVVKLSILDDEMALNGLGHVIKESVSNFNRKFAAKKANEEPPSSGFFQKISNLVGSMFIGPDGHNISSSSSNDAIVLAMYEANHLNRNFFNVLSHVMAIDNATGECGDRSTHPVVERVAVVGSDIGADVGQTDRSEANNLLAAFLTFTSIAIRDTRTDHGATTAKLCFLVLNCIVEDQCSSAFVHDTNMPFKVPLFKKMLYHRKSSADAASSKPLAIVLLDLMVEFIITHMMRSFPFDLYKYCVCIVHRLLCYQKRCRIRLEFQWKELWSALMNLLKFILSNESTLSSTCNIFDLALRIVNIFNVFVTYGDTFLATPTSYDDLYYEIIRVHQIFDNLYLLALRHSSGDSEWKSSASRLASSLVNLKAIIHHFTPKIDSWANAHHSSSLTEDQVLGVIRSNYDTLTLKLIENLESYKKYTETPKETAFFTQLTRSITCRIRDSIAIHDLQQMSVLKEFSTIS
ncbi:armadillo-like helical domain-containing protein 3 [Rhopilema esculentum]|uniref:armadillo-like helical domain-containing protein 3 n=1 Tax=Rhopilema esculentum TaxID=499914 RepID=UPI0031DCF812|eukprot:gene12352-3005_t